MPDAPPSPPPASSALLLDVDGSLIDIAARPEAVVVPTSLIDDLRRADRLLGGALALVSGRSIEQLDALFAPLLLRASGVHGAEMRFEPDEAVIQSKADAVPQPVRRALASVLARFPGVFVEDKRFSLAVHYRAVPEHGPALGEALDDIVRRHGGGDLVLMPGHAVFELKRPGFDKGAAVRRFLDHPRFRGRRPIFVGDDVTDQPGFAAALAAGGVAYGVGRAIAGTVGTFPAPSAVRAWIGAINDTEIPSA